MNQEVQESKTGQPQRKRISVIRTIAVKEKTVLYEHMQISTGEQAAELGRILVKDADRENLIVCCLNAKNQPVSLETVGIGTANACLVGMPEIFKNAILSNATGIIVFHNHPSGDAKPSREDIMVTERLKKAGELLGIDVLDHIILGEDTFTSLAVVLKWTNRIQQGDVAAAGKGGTYHG